MTTALFGLDSSRVLGTAHDAADSWDQVADLIHRHVTSLKDACDQDRAAAGCQPLRMLGVGVEAGAPIYDGQVMPLSLDRSAILSRWSRSCTAFSRLARASAGPSP